MTELQVTYPQVFLGCSGGRGNGRQGRRGVAAGRQERGGPPAQGVLPHGPERPGDRGIVRRPHPGSRQARPIGLWQEGALTSQML